MVASQAADEISLSCTSQNFPKKLQGPILNLRPIRAEECYKPGSVLTRFRSWHLLGTGESVRNVLDQSQALHFEILGNGRQTLRIFYPAFCRREHRTNAGPIAKSLLTSLRNRSRPTHTRWLRHCALPSSARRPWCRGAPWLPPPRPEVLLPSSARRLSTPQADGMLSCRLVLVSRYAVTRNLLLLFFFFL